MNKHLTEASSIDFANAYQAVRQFERLSLDNVSQVELDVLVELYRSYPAPQMMKVLGLSAHCAESTLRGVVTSLMRKAWVTHVETVDSRSRFIRLTREGHQKLRQYQEAVCHAFGPVLS